MGALKAAEYTCGLSVVIVGIGLYSYYVRELLASLVLFTAAFLSLGLVALGMFLIWCAGEKVALRSAPASRNMLALSRRFVIAHTRT